MYRNIGSRGDDARFAGLHYHRNGGFINLDNETLPYHPECATGEGGWLSHKPYAPKSPLPMEKLDRNSFGQAQDFAYYWLGHSNAVLEAGGQRLLIDPVFDNAAPIGLPFVVPRFQEAPIRREELPAIDAVLITHDHYDHLEAATMRYLADKAKLFVVPLGVGARLQSWGVPAEKIRELGWSDGTDVGGTRITAEPALHYSARWRDDRNKTLWVSYVIEGGGKRLFWSGDTGYGKHFAQIGRKYGGFDVAFVEIDAANAGWPKTHMFPKQSVKSVQDLNAAVMVPMHWGVFNLGRNPWKRSITRAAAAAAAGNVRMDVPKQGERYRPEGYRNVKWWEAHE